MKVLYRAEARPLVEALGEAWDCFHELCPGEDVEEFIVEQTGNPEWRGILGRIRDALAAWEKAHGPVHPVGGGAQ